MGHHEKNEQAVHKFSTQSVLVPIDEAIATWKGSIHRTLFLI